MKKQTTERQTQRKCKSCGYEAIYVKIYRARFFLKKYIETEFLVGDEEFIDFEAYTPNHPISFVLTKNKRRHVHLHVCPKCMVVSAAKFTGTSKNDLLLTPQNEQYIHPNVK